MARRKVGGRARRLSWQVTVAIGVVVLAVAVLILKNTVPATTRPSESSATVPVTSASGPVSDDAAALAPGDGELPQDHLERMLSEGHPVYAFFHSTTCYQCIEMTQVVDQVYPDFRGQVALVDVNVYDEANADLLQMAGIRVIPTSIFFDRSGTAQGFTGVIPPEQLRTLLTNISLGNTP